MGMELAHVMPTTCHPHDCWQADQGQHVACVALAAHAARACCSASSMPNHMHDRWGRRGGRPPKRTGASCRRRGEGLRVRSTAPPSISCSRHGQQQD